MTPQGRRDFTYPDTLLSEIETRFGPYRLHLTQTYARGNVQAVLDELNDELDYKAEVAEYLIKNYDWDCFFQYFWGTDRIQHELWHIFDRSHPRHDRDESSLYREKFVDYFRRVDAVVGRLIELAGNASVWVVSDHGFGPVHKYCSFNLWLLNEGFLKLKPDAVTQTKKILFRMGFTPELLFKLVKMLPLGKLRPSRGVSARPGASNLLATLFLSLRDVDWGRTVAFSKGNYGQIYINLKGREPNGMVDPGQYEEVCDRIVERLKALADPLTGGPWVDRVFRREEIYEGPRVADAPDISFLPRDMRYLPLGNADFVSNRFSVDAFGISGCHRMLGVLIAAGAPIRAGESLEKVSIADVAPTMLYLCGQSVPSDMDGRLIREIIKEEHRESNPLKVVAAGADPSAGQVELTAEENEEVIQRLRSLGYIG
jgi:predicted AlkP superfamily phosphohydrolase/phosphomutase